MGLLKLLVTVSVACIASGQQLQQRAPAPIHSVSPTHQHTDNPHLADTSATDWSACDLGKCTCDGVDLSALRNKLYRTHVNNSANGGWDQPAGYVLLISICDEIPRAKLPSGCSINDWAEKSRASAVYYKSDDPSDCLVVGSTGPCPADSNASGCAMTGAKTQNGVSVKYTYEYGCRNTVTVEITHGSENSQLSPATRNECSYSVTHPWTLLGPPPPPPRRYSTGVVTAAVLLCVGLACAGGLVWRRHRQIVIGGELRYSRPPMSAQHLNLHGAE